MNNKKNIVFIYKYNDIVGGINSMINNFILHADNKYNFYIFTDDKQFAKNNSRYNGAYIYELNKTNILRLSKDIQIDSLVIFEPFFEYMVYGILFKILQPNIKLSLYFVGSRTEFKNIREKILLTIFNKFLYSRIAITNYCAKEAGVNNVDILPCPITLDNYKVTNKLFDKKLVILDRLRDRKNQIPAIKALKIINEYDKDIKLYLVGDMYKLHNSNELKDYAKKIVKLIEEYDLQDNVVFYGQASEEEKVNILASCSIMLKTSKHEMQGISTTEGMASGLPVVAFANTGTIEVVKEANGILVENENYEQLAKEVLNLVSDKERLKELSKKALEVVKKYDDRSIAQKFFKIIGVDDE